MQACRQSKQTDRHSKMPGTHTGRQTEQARSLVHRQAGRQAERQAYKVCRETEIACRLNGKQACRLSGKQACRLTGRASMQTDRQSKETDRPRNLF